MEPLFIFLVSCLALSAIPGPNNILCFNYAVYSGGKLAWLGALGRFPAFCVLLLIAACLFIFAHDMNKDVFTVAQILGCGYMVYLGYQILFSKNTSTDAPLSVNKKHFKEEFFTALANPKAIIVFITIFPNFIRPEKDIVLEFLQLGIIALLAELLMASLYVGMGSFLGHKPAFISKVNVFSGVIIIGISISMFIKLI